ncbi:hypothetical protein CPB84DRAFT_1849838 [Gymnopilus junonius]|uniref:Uncharacterized protein n=1 Tax=Gymnopilus junonius TaxID=109634 RepID=A0A9P5TKI0_GYMJU|nr:hypothetical protein CPB84DRAFT_1849838 [Gymnopilus junonius]
MNSPLVISLDPTSIIFDIIIANEYDPKKLSPLIEKAVRALSNTAISIDKLYHTFHSISDAGRGVPMPGYHLEGDIILNEIIYLIIRSRHAALGTCLYLPFCSGSGSNGGAHSPASTPILPNIHTHPSSLSTSSIVLVMEGTDKLANFAAAVSTWEAALLKMFDAVKQVFDGELAKLQGLESEASLMWNYLNWLSGRPATAMSAGYQSSRSLLYVLRLQSKSDHGSPHQQPTTTTPYAHRIYTAPTRPGYATMTKKELIQPVSPETPPILQAAPASLMRQQPS